MNIRGLWIHNIVLWKVKASVVSVLEAESAIKLAEMEGLAGTWDGEAKIITK